MRKRMGFVGDGRVGRRGGGVVCGGDGSRGGVGGRAWVMLCGALLVAVPLLFGCDEGDGAPGGGGGTPDGGGGGGGTTTPDADEAKARFELCAEDSECVSGTVCKRYGEDSETTCQFEMEAQNGPCVVDADCGLSLGGEPLVCKAIATALGSVERARSCQRRVDTILGRACITNADCGVDGEGDPLACREGVPSAASRLAGNARQPNSCQKASIAVGQGCGLESQCDELGEEASCVAIDASVNGVEEQGVAHTRSCRIICPNPLTLPPTTMPATMPTTCPDGQGCLRAASGGFFTCAALARGENCYSADFLPIYSDGCAGETVCRPVCRGENSSCRLSQNNPTLCQTKGRLHDGCLQDHHCESPLVCSEKLCAIM